MDERAVSALPAELEVLWPLRQIPHGCPESAGGSVGRTRLLTYRAVPSTEDVRFLLPADRRAAVAVLRNFRSDGTTRTRIRIAALTATLRVTGGWPLTRGRLDVPVAVGEDSIELLVERLLGEPVVMGVHLGPPRANRKPILQILDRRRRPVAFGKVGLSPLTNSLVSAEGDALATLGPIDLPGVVRPRLLARTLWRDRSVMLTTTLPLGEARPVVSDGLRTRGMVSVSQACGLQELRPADTPYLRHLGLVVDELSNGQIRHHLLGTLRALTLVDDTWTVGSWHGDWTEWNMAEHQDSLLLWDWERFEQGVPVGWDALHFALRDLFKTMPPTPEVPRKLLKMAPALLRPFGVPGVRAETVTFAYLVALAARYTSDGQREAGGRTALVEQWLLPLLPVA